MISQSIQDVFFNKGILRLCDHMDEKFKTQEQLTYTIEQYNKELEEAEAEIARGEFYTNVEVFEASKRLIQARKKSE